MQCTVWIIVNATHAYELVTGYSGAPPAFCMGIPHTLSSSFTPSSGVDVAHDHNGLQKIENPPADLWFTRWILWCNHNLNLRGIDTMVTIMSNALHEWLSTAPIRVRKDFYRSPERCQFIKYVSTQKARNLINKMWRMSPDYLLSPCGTGASIFSVGLHNPCNVTISTHCNEQPGYWSYQRYMTWLRRSICGAPGWQDYDHTDVSSERWLRSRDVSIIQIRHQKLVAIQPFSCHEPVSMILKILTRFKEYIRFVDIPSAGAITMRMQRVPNDAIVLLPCKSTHTAQAFGYHLGLKTNDILPWTHASSKKTSGRVCWVDGASLVPPCNLLYLLRILFQSPNYPTSLFLVICETKCCPKPMDHGNPTHHWWWPMWFYLKKFVLWQQQLTTNNVHKGTSSTVYIAPSRSSARSHLSKMLRTDIGLQITIYIPNETQHLYAGMHLITVFKQDQVTLKHITTGTCTHMTASSLHKFAFFFCDLWIPDDEEYGYPIPAEHTIPLIPESDTRYLWLLHCTHWAYRVTYDDTDPPPPDHTEAWKHIINDICIIGKAQSGRKCH